MSKYIVGDIFQGDFPVTQYYGERVDYYSQVSGGALSKGHEGVDWGTPVGTPILAPFDGIIRRDVDDFKSGAYGNFIVVEDPIQKCAVWFCHLSENEVSVGQNVKKGDFLGKTGNSGNSTAPHLHTNFVETDGNGTRLHTDDGEEGFLNILDPNLVEWKLGDQQSAASVPANPKNPALPSNYDDIIRKSSLYDGFYAAGYVTLDDINKKVEGYEIELKARQDALNKANNKLLGQVEITNADITDDHDQGIKLLAAEHEITNITSDLKLPAGSSEEQIRASIKTLQAPHDELVKYVQPTLERAFEAASYKRVPAQATFLKTAKGWFVWLQKVMNIK
jgi:hypothetical protein